MNRSMYYHEPFSFKPCYKWNAFNTEDYRTLLQMDGIVLNLVINGMPSIHLEEKPVLLRRRSFKPCYKWNAFNTFNDNTSRDGTTVLNLVINGMPSIPNMFGLGNKNKLVLNLVINGMPSILTQIPRLTP